MSKDAILIVLLALAFCGCAFDTELMTEEERERLPGLGEKLDEYRKSGNRQMKFWVGKPKTLENARFHNVLTIYNITEKEEIGEIIRIIQDEVKNAPGWYYVDVKFYEKENWVHSGNVSQRKNETLIHFQRITPKPPGK